MRSMLSGLMALSFLVAAPSALAEDTGERGWRYELRAMGSKAGEAVIHVGKQEKIGDHVLRPIKIDAHTEGMARNFLDATSSATTWVDDAWMPMRARWDQVFDKQKRVVKATYSPKGVKGTDERDGKLFESPDWKLGRRPLDVVSVFTWLRLAELSPGNKYELPVFDGRRIYTVHATVGVAKEIQLPNGIRKAIPIRATITRGSYKRDIELWLSADKERTPLKMVFKYGLLGTVDALFISDIKV